MKFGGRLATPLALVLLLGAGSCQAPDAEISSASSCTTASNAGDSCLVSVHALHPTQFAVGLREVDRKALKIAEVKNNPEKLKKLLKKEPEPLVIGPEGTFFIVDHHHFGRALWNEGVTTTYALVKANLSALSWQEFWNEMTEQGWLYLYNENGEGPQAPSELPATVGEMKDDPYRSLAAEVREAGGFRKTSVLYAEFHWANFFRSRVELGTTEADLQLAIRRAVALAHSPEARDLPGYHLEP